MNASPCYHLLTTVFDGIPSYRLSKLGKKQEETTRSLEKIEMGESRVWRVPGYGGA